MPITIIKLKKASHLSPKHTQYYKLIVYQIINNLLFLYPLVCQVKTTVNFTITQVIIIPIDYSLECNTFKLSYIWVNSKNKAKPLTKI